MINFLVLKAIFEVKGTLCFNVAFLNEMGEEVRSPRSAEFCGVRKDLLAANVLIASDGPRATADVPNVFLASRGALDFDFKFDLCDGALHPGY